MNNYNSILLDTHVWLWLINGAPQISHKIIKLINSAAANNSLYVAAISIWEVSMLETKNRIILNCPIAQWVEKALAAPGTNLLPLSPQIAIESCHLPNFHGDPADRIIVATARIEKLMLITRDHNILNYGKQNQVMVTAT